MTYHRVNLHLVSHQATAEQKAVLRPSARRDFDCQRGISEHRSGCGITAEHMAKELY